MAEKHVETNKEHIMTLPPDQSLEVMRILGDNSEKDETMRDCIIAWLAAPYDTGDHIWFLTLCEAAYYKDRRDARRAGKDVD